MTLSRRSFLVGLSSAAIFPRLSFGGDRAKVLFKWTNLGSTGIPIGDGSESAVLNGKIYSLGGWAPTGVSHNRVFSSQGGAWSESAVTRTWTGRHSFPAVVHQGRIHVLGGDLDSGSFEPNTHSWDGSESSAWQIEETNLPALNRVGHWGMSFGGYLWFGGGQATVGGVTQFFTDRWRSPDGSPGSWELYDDDCALGARGFISGNPPVIDGEAYFIGGGTYQTTDYPSRTYKNDIMKMGSDFVVRCVNPVNMPGMLYHAVEELNGALFIMGGVNGVNFRTVYVSYDKGETLTQLATPPWLATHAATLKAYNGSLYFWGGLDTGQSCYRLDMIDDAQIHHGAPADGVTNLNSTYTVFDRSIALTPGSVVRWIGQHCNSAHAGMKPKIGREITPTQIDVVMNGLAGNHPGGGYHDFEIAPFTVPNDGYTYRIGMSFTYYGASPDSFAFTGAGRSMAAGDVTGSGATFSAPNDGSFPFRWIEA